MLIAQITDCHIVEPDGLMADRVDPASGLRAAIDLINRLNPLPDLVLATGDLVNDGGATQYDHLDSMLRALSMPVLAIAGNHDDRTELRSRFTDLPKGGPDDTIDYVVDDFPVRLIGLDTSIPGRHDGRVTTDQMIWLDRQLSAARERPTIIFQHHPPFASGIPWMDRDAGFTGAELEASVLRRHEHVEAIVCGHVHRAIHHRFAGTVASSCPSTAVQLALDLSGAVPSYTNEPSAIALHQYTDGVLNSHIVPVVVADRWSPSWALEAEVPGDL